MSSSEGAAVATATTGVVKEEKKPAVVEASARSGDREANGAIGDVKQPGDDAVPPQDDDVVEQAKESDDREPTPPDTDDAVEDDPIVPDPLITTDMLAEQRQLEAERRQREEQQDAESEERMRREGVESAALTKLDVLLEKTKLFSESLLQQMDDITLLPVPTPPPQADSKGEGGKKRKGGGTGKGRGRKKSKTDTPEETLQEKISAAPSAAINGSGDAATAAATTKEEEEAALLREQREIAPNLTGCTLKWYQIKGVKWLISLWQNGLNGILADQMGLGKTVQTIAFLAHLMSHGIFGPFLVVAPLSTLSNWVNEVKRFVPTANVLLYHGSKDVRTELREKHMPKQVREGFPIIVTSFEVAMFDRRQLQRYHWKYIVVDEVGRRCLTLTASQLQRYHWKYIIVDEGHRLKNMHCKLIRELRQLPVENTLLLSGTPLQNNLQELWSLLNFILPAIFSDLHEFTSWFDLAGRQSGGVDQKVFDNERRSQVVAKLHQILRPFLLRRIKADVEQSLPKKKEIVLYAQLTAHQREFQDHLVQRTLEDFLNSTIATCTAPPAFLRRVLIFSQMTRLLDILDYYLEERGHHPFRLDGSVKLDDRRQQIEEFNTSPEAFIFLLSTRAGGLGINLTAADTVIIYDSDWVRAVAGAPGWNGRGCMASLGEIIRLLGSARIGGAKTLRHGPWHGLGINLTAADTAIIYDADWGPHQDMQAMDRCHRYLLMPSFLPFLPPLSPLPPTPPSQNPHQDMQAMDCCHHYSLPLMIFIPSSLPPPAPSCPLLPPPAPSCPLLPPLSPLPRALQNPHQDMQAMDRCHCWFLTLTLPLPPLSPPLRPSVSPAPLYPSEPPPGHAGHGSLSPHRADAPRARVPPRHCPLRGGEGGSGVRGLEHLVIEKGQFQQDKAAPAKTKIDESEVLSLLRPERSQHDELVQSAEISDENFNLLLDRTDMLHSPPTPPPAAAATPAAAPAAAGGDAKASGEGSGGGGEKAPGVVRSLPVAGPGWEVVVAGTAPSSVLSSIA
ncbi:unnamed protein product [Closterium sp. NIES-53]